MREPDQGRMGSSKLYNVARFFILRLGPEGGEMDELLVEAPLVRLVRRSLSLVIKTAAQVRFGILISHRSPEYKYFLRIPWSCCPLLLADIKLKRPCI